MSLRIPQNSVSGPRRSMFVAGLGLAVASALFLGVRLAGDPSPNENKGLKTPILQPQAAHARSAASSFDRVSAPVSAVAGSTLRERFLQARDIEALRAMARDMILSNTEQNLRIWAELLLAEKDAARRATLLEALDLLLGEASIEMITQLITLTDMPDVNAALARTLSRTANPDTLQHLTEIYAEAMPGSRQRERVLELIAGVTNPYAVSGLVEVAGNASLDKEITERAIISLSKIGDEAALDGLVRTYDSWPADSLRRKDVLQGIASSYNSDSRPYLENLAASSTVPEIAIAAKKALKNMLGEDSKSF